MKDFKELSFEAWTYSEQVNQEERATKVQSQRDDKGSALADEDVDTVITGSIRPVTVFINGTSFIRLVLWQLVGERLEI